MTKHECHAHGCTVSVPPRMLMCRRHWRRVPKPIQRAIWREYRRGQEIDKNPSAAYLAVQRLAVAMVAFEPNDEQAAQVSANYLTMACVFRTIAMGRGGPDPLRGLLPEGVEVPDVTLEQARMLARGDG